MTVACASIAFLMLFNVTFPTMERQVVTLPNLTSPVTISWFQVPFPEPHICYSLQHLHLTFCISYPACACFSTAWAFSFLLLLHCLWKHFAVCYCYCDSVGPVGTLSTKVNLSPLFEEMSILAYYCFLLYFFSYVNISVVFLH